MTSNKVLVEVTPTSLIGIGAKNVDELIIKIHQGFPYESFAKLQKEIGISTKELANLLQIPTRTLARRRRNGVFKSDESERILRFSRVYTKTLGLFDFDISRTRQWIKTEKIALGGNTPLEYAITEIGAKEVENLIGRLEYGVFS